MMHSGLADMAPLASAARIGLLTLALVGLVSGESAAAKPTPANEVHLTAVANVPDLPRGMRISIEPGRDDAEFGNAPLYVSARKVIDRDLKRRGIRASGASDMTIGIRVDITGFKARRRQSFDVFPGRPPPPAGAQDRSPVVHQFTFQLDPESDRAPTKTSVVLTLFQPGKPPLWTATATIAGSGDAPEALVARLTRAAMNAFGTSVQRSIVPNCNDNAKPAGARCKE